MSRRKGASNLEAIGYVLVIIVSIILIVWYMQRPELKSYKEVDRADVNLNIIQENLNLGCFVDYLENRFMLMKIPDGKLTLKDEDLCISSLRSPPICRTLFCNTGAEYEFSLDEGLVLDIKRDDSGFTLTEV